MDIVDVWGSKKMAENEEESVETDITSSSTTNAFETSPNDGRIKASKTAPAIRKDKDVKNFKVELTDELESSLASNSVGLEKFREHASIVGVETSSLSSRNSLVEMKTNSTDRVKTEFPCFFCDRVYTTKHGLLTHEAKHKKKRQDGAGIECAICFASFRPGNDLETHKLIHTGDKPFQCKLCGHRTNQKSNLNTHMKSHPEIKEKKTHCCDKCGMNFTNPYLLKSHKLLHEEKKHECDICVLKFSALNYMKTHKKLHGKKTLFCRFCEFKCHRKDTLTAHEARHSEEKPFACTSCEYRCKTRLFEPTSTDPLRRYAVPMPIM